MNFLQRFFSQPKTDEKPAAQPSVPIEAPKTGGLHCLPAGLHVGRLSDIGQIRERNEDSFYVFQALLQSDGQQEPCGLFLIADGMGGHQKGEVASALAVRTSAEFILKEIYLAYLNHRPQTAASTPINEVLTTAVEKANEAVQASVPNGGTTLTIALVMGRSAYIAHVGDSRVYWFNQDNLKQVTKDHSLVQRLVEMGQETPEGALVHPQRNVLYRAIGQGAALEVDTYMQILPPGSSLLLCSDGLWGLLTQAQLSQALAMANTPQHACEQLINLANNHGGEDNITAVVVSMGLEN